MSQKDIFNAITKSSADIIIGANDLKNRISSAKNYIADSTLDRWGFCKQVATENFGVMYGSQSKLFFLKHNFYNILEHPDKPFRNLVISKFLDWSDGIDYLDMRKKFNEDQKNKRRFELLVHFKLIPSGPLGKNEMDAVVSGNQNQCDEGFLTEITKEVSSRNQALVRAAKKYYGTKCAVCDFQFINKYGEHGAGFVEMHHLFPIADGPRKSKIEDLRPVCANCHRMLHKGDRMLTIAELKGIIEYVDNAKTI